MSIREHIQQYCPSLVARLTAYGLYSCLARNLLDCRTVIDIGCGADSILKHFTEGREFTGLDTYEPSLEKRRLQGRYAHLIQGDITSTSVQDRGYDAAVALDVIEHLTKPDGHELLSRMERTARKKVIVFTPNGFVPQPANDNPWQEHKCGWTLPEFRARGYRVYGIYGWKALRGEGARLRFRPWFLWELFSVLTQPMAASFPQTAYSLCAVKSL